METLERYLAENVPDEGLRAAARLCGRRLRLSVEVLKDVFGAAATEAKDALPLEAVFAMHDRILQEEMQQANEQAERALSETVERLGREVSQTAERVRALEQGESGLPELLRRTVARLREVEQACDEIRPRLATIPLPRPSIARAKEALRTDDPEDMEPLAACEHESWSNWTKYMLKTMGEEFDGMPEEHREMAILPCVQRWRRQLATPYEELREAEKESDRKIVREKLRHYRPARS